MKKGNNLTLYIVIALVVGIALGFILNSGYVKEENKAIAAADVRINQINSALVTTTDTTSPSYKQLVADRVAQTKVKKESLAKRDSKTDPFALLADVFLRLIKMIVAPLVFFTLVVGVAKLGDMKAVGRIGGKTMLWFISASLLSLTLGMILVNFFEPGIAMHLPLPDKGTET
ncbi:MAG: cation:dicarboxylase symporter family transporter, partial [Chitinophagaceae bacterium]|nr:cation:dicarboxylase symporter family transporter [Chitinophagaceae bacterium]